MNGYQIYVQALASLTISASAKLRVQLRDLEVMLGESFLHLVGFKISAFLDPTYTAVPTKVGHNNLLASVRFHDGQSQLFNLCGNSMRIQERVEIGRSLMPEAETDNGSGNERYFSRFFPLGPLGMAGGYKDFVQPAASLRNGYLAIDLCALTDLSADTTAMAGTIEVEAIMVAREDLVIGPKVERREDDVTQNAKLEGRALYTHLSAVTGTDYASLAANELGNITVKTGTKTLVAAVPANVLWRVHQLVTEAGMVGGLMGEPAHATYDTNGFEKNLGTPAAIAALPFDAQPILFCSRGAKISSVFAYVPSTLVVTTSGTSTSHRLISTRILPQTKDEVERKVEAAAKELNVNPGAFKPQLLDKSARVPRGYREFLPYKFKAVRKAA